MAQVLRSVSVFVLILSTAAASSKDYQDINMTDSVDDAALLQAVGSPRPTKCPAGGMHTVNICDRNGVNVKDDNFDDDGEASKCSCGIPRSKIPGPYCSHTQKVSVVNGQPPFRHSDIQQDLQCAPTPYWGTGYNGCYCWCCGKAQ